jgi:hypothetical protein
MDRMSVVLMYIQIAIVGQGENGRCEIDVFGSVPLDSLSPLKSSGGSSLFDQGCEEFFLGFLGPME